MIEFAHEQLPVSAGADDCAQRDVAELTIEWSTFRSGGSRSGGVAADDRLRSEEA